VRQSFFNLPKEVASYAAALQRDGVVQIPNILCSDAVAKMEAELAQLPWDMAYVLKGEASKISVSDVMVMHPQRRGQFFADIAKEAAQKPYAFCYDSYMLITHYIKNSKPSSVFHQYVEQVCHPDMVEFMRQLTGNDSVIKADGQVSRYLAGHFLKSHDDNGAPSGQIRVAAYTISLSRIWNADWGGVLHMQHEDFSISRSIIPTFNTLTVFSVPQFHFVSQVANYCPVPRYSIVGWFRADK
jgi:Rps23 Pro-64 3,4-dihydroxylase Tpa1-like proline 4-hydroxylase